MDNLEELRRLADELQEYAELEGTELGETCRGLVMLASVPYSLSDEFMEALIDEISILLEYFKENCRIVEKEVVDPAYIVKELEWPDV